MLEIIIGSRRDPIGTEELIRALDESDLTGTLYIAYPVLSTVDEPVAVDGLLISQEHGIAAFDLHSNGTAHARLGVVGERQADLHAALFQKLFSYRPLRKERTQLAVDIRVATVSPDVDGVQRDDDVVVVGPEYILDFVREGRPLTEEQYRQVNATIERVSTLKPAIRRSDVSKAHSRGAVMQEIDQQIANLDRWQKRAAIETPEGPQRLRGLAGSGKTIVLALKAAYLHTQHPEWDIALTFHTRSLYQQFQELVRRFSYEAINDEPDWRKLRILHSWGTQSSPGIYSTLAQAMNRPVRDFSYGRRKYGYESSFEGVCRELLKDSSNDLKEPLFDALLIDEAQDLPQPFFELAYLSTRPPHRVVWAYDEMQNLGEHVMPPLEQLFGTGNSNTPRIGQLSNDPPPRQDIILPVCYRNTPWALTTAHALGFGIYRDNGLVQFFDDPALWRDIGYEVISGEISPGHEVTLRRSKDSYPSYFEELLDPGDAVTTQVFSDPEAQASWVAEQIYTNITEDELQVRDILVILSNPITARSDVGVLMSALTEYNIAAHLAGVTSSVDQLFDDSSIAISGIYRAKGNEAPMVYVLNAEYGARPGLELIRRRNTLFTGITRSRAWVRLCGCGERMTELAAEVAKISQHHYQLRFKVPTPDELEHLRRIHRDMSPTERETIRSAEKNLGALLEMIEKGDLSSEALPDELLSKLEKLVSPTDDNDS